MTFNGDPKREIKEAMVNPAAKRLPQAWRILSLSEFPALSPVSMAGMLDRTKRSAGFFARLVFSSKFAS
jgi:hypothetical protein